MRKDLIAEGHLVPPPITKGHLAQPVDKSVRGFVRADEEGDDYTTVRPILYGEHVPDRRFSLPVGDRVVHDSDVEGEDEQEEWEAAGVEESPLLPSMSVPEISPERQNRYATPRAYRMGNFEPQSGVKFTPSFSDALDASIDVQTPSRSSARASHHVSKQCSLA